MPGVNKLAAGVLLGEQLVPGVVQVFGDLLWREQGVLVECEVPLEVDERCKQAQLIARNFLAREFGLRVLRLDEGIFNDFDAFEEFANELRHALGLPKLVASAGACEKRQSLVDEIHEQEALLLAAAGHGWCTGAQTAEDHGGSAEPQVAYERVRGV